MSVLDSLITDRTAADAAYIRQLAALGLAGRSTEQNAEWGDGTEANKGAYNAIDLNRVGSAVAYLQTELAALGITADISGNKTDWTMSDVPTAAQRAAYLANLAAVIAALNAPADMPSVPDDLDGLTYDEANDIEQILVDAGTEIERIEAAWRRCGQANLFCGGVSLPIGGD